MSIDETIDIVDCGGTVLRQESKFVAHEKGLLHKTVQGIVRSGDNWWLVRQTADRQDAGQFVPPVGGHVKAGESNAAALLRETEEEIGVTSLVHTFVGTATLHRQVIGRDENHLFFIYEITTEEPFKLGSEADAIIEFTPGELTALLHKSPEQFGGALYFALEYFYPALLPKSYVYRYRQKPKKP